MPADSIVVAIGVVTMFSTFAIALLWADVQTRR